MSECEWCHVEHGNDRCPYLCRGCNKSRNSARHEGICRECRYDSRMISVTKPGREEGSYYKGDVLLTNEEIPPAGESQGITIPIDYPVQIVGYGSDRDLVVVPTHGAAVVHPVIAMVDAEGTIYFATRAQLRYPNEMETLAIASLP